MYQRIFSGSRCRANRLAVGAVLVTGLAVSLTHGAPAPLPARMEPVALDSGRLENVRAEPAVVYSQTIDLAAEIPWVRVLFDKETTLSPGSYIRVTSLLDGETQILDAQELQSWNFGTAFFNGSTVKVEVIGGREAKSDRVRISEVYAGGYFEAQEVPTEGGVADICGANDNRELSGDPRVGRLLQGTPQSPIDIPGCTAFIVDTPAGVNKVHMSAGHCFGAPGGTTPAAIDLARTPRVLQFNVPPSNPNCTLNHPPVRFQFAVENALALDNGCGDDWAVFHCSKAKETGLTTYETQGAAFKIAREIPAPPAAIRVTGYGVDGNLGEGGGGNIACTACLGAPVAGMVKGARNKVQQKDTGITKACPGAIAGSIVYEDAAGVDVDTCSANSGSPIELLSSGEVIGIHAYSGCAGGPVCCPTLLGNSGTPIRNPKLQTALGVEKGKASVTAVSEWALGALALLLLSGVAIKFGRRHLETRN